MAEHIMYRRVGLANYHCLQISQSLRRLKLCPREVGAGQSVANAPDSTIETDDDWVLVEHVDGDRGVPTP